MKNKDRMIWCEK